jgi:hypothetical protein
MNFTKVKEVFVNNRPRNKKLLHFMIRCYFLRETPKYSHYRRVSAHLDNLTSSQFFIGLEKEFAVLDGSIV